MPIAIELFAKNQQNKSTVFKHSSNDMNAVSCYKIEINRHCPMRCFQNHIPDLIVYFGLG